MRTLDHVIAILGQEDRIITYEQELAELLEDLRRWRKELYKNPEKSKEILNGIDLYMKNLGPKPNNQLDQAITRSLEQGRWEETRKYMEMSGKNKNAHIFNALYLLGT